MAKAIEYEKSKDKITESLEEKLRVGFADYKWFIYEEEFGIRLELTKNGFTKELWIDKEYLKKINEEHCVATIFLGFSQLKLMFEEGFANLTQLNNYYYGIQNEKDN